MEPTRRSRGFSLVEAILTLSLIGILSALAAPRFLSGPNFREKIYFDEVVSSLRYAKQLAVASGCSVQVDFSGGAGLTLRQRAACTTGSFSRDVRHPDGTSTSFETSTPSGVSFSANVDPLLFDALGRATNGSGTVSDAMVATSDFSASVVGETGFVDVSP